MSEDAAAPADVRADTSVDADIAAARLTFERAVAAIQAAWALLCAELRLARSSAIALAAFALLLVFLGVGAWLATSAAIAAGIYELSGNIFYGIAAVALGIVGLVAAGPHGGLDRFKVRAGLGVDPSAEPRHVIGPLRAQVQPAAPGAVLVGEQPIGVEVVGDALAQLFDDFGIDLARMLDQPALGIGHVGRRDAGGQYVDRSAHCADMVLADGTGRRGRARSPAALAHEDVAPVVLLDPLEVVTPHGGLLRR